MKQKLVSYIKFNNGARFKCYVMGNIPSLAKEANDYIYLKVTPDKDRSDEDLSFYMNIYDANNLIWVLTTAILEAQERGIDHLPKNDVKERLIK